MEIKRDWDSVGQKSDLESVSQRSDWKKGLSEKKVMGIANRRVKE